MKCPEFQGVSWEEEALEQARKDWVRTTPIQFLSAKHYTATESCQKECSIRVEKGPIGEQIESHTKRQKKNEKEERNSEQTAIHRLKLSDFYHSTTAMNTEIVGNLILRE